MFQFKVIATDFCDGWLGWRLSFGVGVGTFVPCAGKTEGNPGGTCCILHLVLLSGGVYCVCLVIFGYYLCLCAKVKMSDSEDEYSIPLDKQVSTCCVLLFIRSEVMIAFVCSFIDEMGLCIRFSFQQMRNHV